MWAVHRGSLQYCWPKKGKRSWGIDSERSRIEYAENDKSREGIGDNLTFVCDDFLSHKFDSKFDCVDHGRGP